MKSEIFQKEFISKTINPLVNVWLVPENGAKLLLSFAKKFGFKYSKQLTLLSKKSLSSYKIYAEKGKIIIVFPYIHEIINEVRKIPDINYSKGRWVTSPEHYKVIKSFDNTMIYMGYQFIIDNSAKILMLKTYNQKVKAKKTRLLNINKILSKEKYKIKPYAHQVEGIRLGLLNKKFGIFDQPGVGKTLQVVKIIEILKRYKLVDKCLIICPNGLKLNWYKEIKNNTTSLISLVGVYDAGATKSLIMKYPFFLKNLRKKKDIKKKEIVIINYESVFKYVKKLSRFLNNKKSIIVLDESHRIKNIKARVTKSIQKLKKNSNYRFILTGTPVANKPMDLWSQLRFIEASVPEKFGTFKRLYCDDSDSEENLKLLKGILTECSIRRLKSECLDLPEKIYQFYRIELEKEQRKIYDKMKRELYLKILKNGQYEEMHANLIIVMLLRLAQIIASNPALITDDYNWKKAAKFVEMKSIVGDLVYEGQKVLIWTNYRYNVRCLMEMMSNQGYNPVKIVGGMKGMDREESKRRFMKDDGCKVFIAIPKAAKEGITLTSSHTAIYLDKTFSLTDWVQSQDRIHRISQKSKVLILSMIGIDTIDELIEEKMKEKQYVAEYIQDDLGKQSFKKIMITKEDLEKILL